MVLLERSGVEEIQRQQLEELKAAPTHGRSQPTRTDHGVHPDGP